MQLAAGLESLKVFQGEVEGLAKQREQLRLAEQLFDMDITSYPLLSKVSSSSPETCGDLSYGCKTATMHAWTTYLMCAARGSLLACCARKAFPMPLTCCALLS